jgi:hypothetical protein
MYGDKQRQYSYLKSIYLIDYQSVNLKIFNF